MVISGKEKQTTKQTNAAGAGGFTGDRPVLGGLEFGFWGGGGREVGAVGVTRCPGSSAPPAAIGSGAGRRGSRFVSPLAVGRTRGSPSKARRGLAAGRRPSGGGSMAGGETWRVSGAGDGGGG